jgi:hypothetical protein
MGECLQRAFTGRSTNGPPVLGSGLIQPAGIVDMIIAHIWPKRAAIPGADETCTGFECPDRYLKAQTMEQNCS